jgi:hypothetical protein
MKTQLAHQSVRTNGTMSSVITQKACHSLRRVLNTCHLLVQIASLVLHADFANCLTILGQLAWLYALL